MSGSVKNIPADPKKWVADLEAVWQARDGEQAGKGFTPDAVQVWGNSQRQSGPELAERPKKWFAYAKDLQIKKKYIAHSDDTIVASWDSVYTHPETGKKVHERGIEYFVFRDGLVAEQHAWQHSWTDGEQKNESFSTD